MANNDSYEVISNQALGMIETLGLTRSELSTAYLIGTLLGAVALLVARLVRARVLCDRDDGHRCRPLRPGQVWHGGLQGLTTPG